MRLVVTQTRLNFCKTVGSAPATKAPMFAGKENPYCDGGSLASGWGSVKWPVAAVFSLLRRAAVSIA